MSKSRSRASKGLIRAAGLAFSLVVRTVKNLQCRRPEFDPWFRKIAWRREWASQSVLVVKNPAADAGEIRDLGSILGSGRSPGGGNGNPLLCSCLENPTGRGAWRATVRSIRLSTHTWMGPMKSSRKDGFVKSGWADQTLELLMGMCSRNVPVFTHYLFAWCWEWWFQKSPLCLSRQLSISK